VTPKHSELEPDRAPPARANGARPERTPAKWCDWVGRGRWRTARPAAGRSDAGGVIRLSAWA